LRLSLVVLALVVAVLGLAGFATAGRLGVWQTSGPAVREPLDPERVGGSDAGTPLPSGLCPPEPERSGAAGSNADFGGVCAFHQASRVYCRATDDDFYVLLRRQLPNGRSLSLYANVERYHGPGVYRDVQILMLVRDVATIYQWSNFRAEATVTARETSFRLPLTELRSETGRAGAGVETASGTFACGGEAAG
jgi:hypothetical protein